MITYYAQMVDCTGTGKTPKYEIVKEWGNYKPMESLVGKNGKVSMYLMEKQEGAKSSTPSMRLQAKGSLNFTGLKDYFVDGKLSGVAYGYPLSEKTYSKDNKPNPFYEFREDAFLFITHPNKDTPNGKPTMIEMLVINGGKVLAASYCKQLLLGGYQRELEALRKQASVL